MKNQNPFIALAAISGLDVSPRIRAGTKNVYLRSIDGTPAQIDSALRQLIESGYDTTGMVAFGSGIEDNGETKVHMVCLDVNPTVNLNTASANVDKTIVKAQLQDDYDYTRLLGSVPTGKDGEYVRAASWGVSFRDQPNAEQVFGLAFNRFFSDNGTVRGAKGENIRTMLLIGNNDERITLVGKANEDSFKILPPTGFQTEERHAIIGTTLVVGEYDGQQVAGLQGKTIAAWLETDGESAIDYSFDKLNDGIGAISEIAIVDGSSRSTLVTLKDGNYAYLPVGIHFDGEVLELRVDIDKATTVETVGVGFQPIVRLSAIASQDKESTAAPRYALTTVNQNGGTKVIAFGRSSDLPPAFTTTAKAAACDEIFAQGQA